MADVIYPILNRYCYIKTASAGVTITLGTAGQTLSFAGGELLLDLGEKPEDRPPQLSIISTASVMFHPYRIERLK